MLNLTEVPVVQAGSLLTWLRREGGDSISQPSYLLSTSIPSYNPETVLCCCILIYYLLKY